MKTSTVGLVLAAILMVLASVGFGIAQAGGNHTDGPVLSFEDQEALEQSDSSNSHVPVLSSGIDLSYDADGNPSSDVALATGNQSYDPMLSFGDQDVYPSSIVAQMRGTVETGSMPDEVNADSSAVEIEGVSYYRIGGTLYGP
jgi:hypothetical protein